MATCMLILRVTEHYNIYMSFNPTVIFVLLKQKLVHGNFQFQMTDTSN